jgi:hypothetical protein
MLDDNLEHTNFMERISNFIVDRDKIDYIKRHTDSLRYLTLQNFITIIKKMLLYG